MNNIVEDKILMFECCKVVKGASKSLIYDLQRKTNRYIPNDLANLLTESLGLSLHEIKAKYNHQFHDVIEENIKTLINEEYLFEARDASLFPLMSVEWDEPKVITNGIIEIGSYLNNEIKLWKELGDLGCEHVELRAYLPLTMQYLLNLFNTIKNERILSVDLIIPHGTLRANELIEFVHAYPRISNILLHSSREKSLIYASPTDMGNISSTKTQIDNRYHCGQVSTENFVVNIKSYTESLQHNSCLNRKISIDTNGNIKNCPSLSETFGNIRNITLAEAYEKLGFKKYWNINKDFIDICKDCEFRYMCHDCRAYVEEPNDTSGPEETNLSKPLKCGYNPYTGEWSGWSDNPLKQKAIDLYGMREMVNEIKS